MVRSGVIVAQGGAFGGWTLYAHEGRPAYCYNLFGLQRFKVYGADPIPAGDHQVRVEFAYDGGGLAKGGTATLFVDGTQVGEGRVDAHGAHGVLGRRDVATSEATRRRRSPTTSAEGETEFNGRIRWVELAIGDDAEDADHLISPEERYRIAMARQ